MSYGARLWILIALVSLGSADAQQLGTAKIPAVASEPAADRGLLLGIYFPNGATWDDLRNYDAQKQKWVPDVSMDPQGKYLTFWISRSGGKPGPPKSDSEIDGRSVRLITYAGPEYVASLFHWEGGAGAWEYVYPHVTSVADSTKDLSLEKVLGPATGAQYKRLAKSMNHMIDAAATLVDGEGNIQKGAYLHWELYNCGDNVPQVQGLNNFSVVAEPVRHARQHADRDHHRECLRQRSDSLW